MATKTREQWATRFNVPQDAFDMTLQSVRHEIRGDMVYMLPNNCKVLKFRLGKLRRNERIEPYKPLPTRTAY